MAGVGGGAGGAVGCGCVGAAVGAALVLRWCCTRRTDPCRLPWSALPALPWIDAAAVGLLEAMAFLHRLFAYPSIEMHAVEG